MDRRHRRAIHSVGVVVEGEAVQSISAITVESVRVPDLPVEMRRRIVLAWGDEARAWLDAVPLIAARRSDAWNLELAETIVGGFDSWVLTCADELGQRRILKLTPDRRSARAQAETLRAWERLGASRCVGLVAFDERRTRSCLNALSPEPTGRRWPMPDARSAKRPQS